MQRVVVTGSEGFIGKNLCPYLEKRGIEVVPYDIKFGGSLPPLNGIDAVIHLGANSSTTETDLKKILNENFIFSGTLYQLCANMDIKFQYASSASVYGVADTFQEDQFCIPLSPYAYSKYMFDNWLLNEKHPYQGFRYFNVYGPHEEHKGDQASPITKFVNKFKNMVRSKFLEEKPAETSSMLRMFVKFIIGCFIMMTLGSLMLALVILFLLGILLTKWQRILEQKLSK